MKLHRIRLKVMSRTNDGHHKGRDDKVHQHPFLREESYLLLWERRGDHKVVIQMLAR